jgi:uncharacterized protein
VPVTFLADATLGKMVTWLRILGYDTAAWKGRAGRDFLRKAAAEKRCALTRRRDLARRQFSGCLAVIHSDLIDEQLPELLETLALSPDPQRFFTRCLQCNERLEDILRKDVQGRVPVYVAETNETFRVCRRCGGIFWPGTHRDRMEEALRKRIPTRLP